MRVAFNRKVRRQEKSSPESVPTCIQRFEEAELPGRRNLECRHTIAVGVVVVHQNVAAILRETERANQADANRES
jgi:hypothetical protein